MFQPITLERNKGISNDILTMKNQHVLNHLGEINAGKISRGMYSTFCLPNPAYLSAVQVGSQAGIGKY